MDKKKIIRIKISNAVLKELEEIMKDYVETYVEKRFSSLSFMENVNELTIGKEGKNGNNA